MTLKTHLETGLAFSLLASGAAIDTIDEMSISPVSKLAILAAIILGISSGSVYPDLDYDDSTLNADDISMEWQSKLDHRGIVHTLVNVVGLSIPFILLSLLLEKVILVDTIWIAILGISMGIGCIFHMLIDSFTLKGIAWLYPISLHRFRIPLVKNYTIERIFRIFVTVGLLYGGIYHWSKGL